VRGSKEDVSVTSGDVKRAHHDSGSFDLTKPQERGDVRRKRI
jgi:hypothetical protein